jgi:two-component system LytT family response regulator
MRLSALILDDEKSACRVLNSMLDEYCPEVDVKLVTQDPHLALEQMKIIQPQILFIDINMPKMSGFEFIDKLENFKGKIVFTTAYDQYAIQAFQYAAFDYLMKPIHVEQLEHTISRLVKEFKPVDNSNAIRELFTFMDKENADDEGTTTIAVHQNGDMKFIQKKDICYLEASGNYTIIHCEEEKYTVSKTLKEYETILDSSVYFRVHKSFIANMNKVEKFTLKSGGSLVLKNGNLIPVSRRKRHLVYQFST